MSRIYDFIRRIFSRDARIAYLIDKLRDGDIHVELKAADALGEIGEPAVPALIDALKDVDVRVWLGAAKALGKIGEPAVPALIDALKNEKYMVRWKATSVLGEIKDTRAVPALVEALKDDTIRRDAAKTLEKIGFEKIGLNEKILCLLELGEDKEIVAIGKPAVPALINVLKDDSVDYLRVSAAWLLEEIKDTRAVPALIDALKDENWRVRGNVASVLGEIKDARAVPGLVDALKDAKADVRKSAEAALVRIGEPAVPALVDALENSDIQGKAADVLLKMGKHSVPGLIGALKNKDDRVRWAAADMLGKIEDARAVPALVVMLKDEKVRIRATVALDEIILTITENHLMELEKGEKMLMKVIEKTEGEEKKNLLDLLDKINRKRNKILEPEAKKLKPPKRIKRKGKPKRIWRTVQ